MRNIFKTTWENFKRLMVLFGFEIIMSALLISIGVAFVATTQGVGPDQYLANYEFAYAQLIFAVAFIIALARLMTEVFEVEDEPKPEPTSAPEPAQTEA